MILALGKFTTNPGTLKRLTSTQANPAEKFGVHGVMVQALKTNTGAIYVGTSTLNRSTGAGVIACIPIPTVNSVSSFTAALTLSPNAINLSDLYLDVDVNGEGAQVSALIA